MPELLTNSETGIKTKGTSGCPSYKGRHTREGIPTREAYQGGNTHQGGYVHPIYTREAMYTPYTPGRHIYQVYPPGRHIYTRFTHPGRLCTLLYIHTREAMYTPVYTHPGRHIAGYTPREAYSLVHTLRYTRVYMPPYTLFVGGWARERDSLPLPVSLLGKRRGLSDTTRFTVGLGKRGILLGREPSRI